MGIIQNVHSFIKYLIRNQGFLWGINSGNQSSGVNHTCDACVRFPVFTFPIIHVAPTNGRK